MQEVRPRQRPTEIPREAGFQASIRESLGRIALNISWVRDTLWPDEWANRFSPKKPLVAANENRPFLVLKSAINSPDSDISFFILLHPVSRHWERCAARLEAFCLGAGIVLDHFVRSPPNLDQETLTQDVQQSKSWVSDRNVNPEDPNNPFQYEAVLSTARFFEVLRKPRLSERDNHQNDIVIALPRRIYVADPDGPSILALIRTAPASQVNALRELFSNYVTQIPVPQIKVIDSPDWWNGVFNLHFNFPYSALSTVDKSDIRTLYGQQPLRRRYSLSFLFPLQNGHESFEEQDPVFRGQAFLHEAVCSCVVTGPHDQYWTAVCLNEEFFEGESSLELADQIDEPTGSSDPITDEAGEDCTLSARTYFLQAMAATLKKIIAHQGDIHELFEASIRRRRDAPTSFVHNWPKRFQEILTWMIGCQSRSIEQLDKYLNQVVVVGADGTPKGHSMQSLGNDKLAIKSLKSIMHSFGELISGGYELERFMKSCEEARRERKNEHAEELRILADSQQDLGRKLGALTLFGVAVGMLTLVAQLYGCVPEDPLSKPGFMAITILTGILGVVSSAVLLGKRLIRGLEKAWVWLHRHRNETERIE